MALEFGAILAHKNEISTDKPVGFTAMFDYSWQLSGLDGSKRSSFISVPIGYSYYPENPSIGILSYGWTVRHNLTKNRSVTPYLGYGLLLNQLSYSLDKGKRFGHQSRFDFGAEWFSDKQLRLFSKVEWSMTKFPVQTGGSDWMYTVALKVGIRFYKPARVKKELAKNLNN